MGSSRVLALGLIPALLWLGTVPGGAMTIKTGDRSGLLSVRKGFRFLGVDVSGNSNIFLANNRQVGADALSLGGKFEQTLRVDVDMEVIPRVSVRGRFDDTLFPAKQELAVDYRNDDLTITAGDIVAGFNGVEFPMESQNLFGIKGRYRTDGHDVMAVGARLSGTAGHLDTRGDNTKGPYFLPDRKIVANSDHVYVDGVRKYRGTDYALDYQTGVLTFTEPVDDRFKITADYEFEPIGSVLGSSLLVSRYAGEVTTNANVGLSMGLRSSGGGAERQLVGADGRIEFESGVALGGEMAASRMDGVNGLAMRSEFSGTTMGVGWNGSARLVDANYNGLGSVTARKDVADASFGTSYAVNKNVRLSSRLATSRDNIGKRAGQPSVTDWILENGVVWLAPRRTRLEFTLDNRNELHRDDLATHAIDNDSTSCRVGTRYRLDRHMARVTYELRSSVDRSNNQYAEHLTHVANTQLQSRFFESLFTTTTLQLTRSEDAATGKATSEELLSGIDLSMSLFKHLGATTSYTLQERTGVSEGTTHSATLTFRGQQLRNLTAEAALQVKRTVPLVGEPVGDSVVSGRAAYQLGSKLSLSADYQRRLAGLKTVGPVTLDTRASFRPSKEWELGGGYRIDELDDTSTATNSYTGRIAYMEATVNF